MIYYVEDDANVRELAIYALTQAGLSARGFPSAAPFFAACKESLPDLVLLDIMLPDIDGLEILRRLREGPDGVDLPVMMLSAKGTEYDKVVALDDGADDYLAKPFGMMELVSRCRALLRRSMRGAGGLAADGPRGSILRCGPIVLDPASHNVTVGGNPIDLTLKEFTLLEKLMGRPGQVFSRAQLLRDVWQMDFAGETRTVDTHVQTLRRKLGSGAPGAGDLVQTVRGVGYRMSHFAARGGDHV